MKDGDKNFLRNKLRAETWKKRRIKLLSCTKPEKDGGSHPWDGVRGLEALFDFPGFEEADVGEADQQEDHRNHDGNHDDQGLLGYSCEENEVEGKR